MTTIVYDHKNGVIAYDSRLSSGTMIVSDGHDKHKVCHRGWHWFISATEHDVESFIDDFQEHAEAEVRFDVDAVVVIDREVYNAYTFEGVFKMCRLVSNEGFGSGGKFALAALDFGKSATEAVRYAMKRDSGTGGKVRKFKV